MVDEMVQQLRRLPSAAPATAAAAAAAAAGGLDHVVEDNHGADAVSAEGDVESGGHAGR